MSQTLEQLSQEYQHSADLLRTRIADLRRQLAATQDQKETYNLRIRIRELTPMLKEMEAMVETTANYYNPSHYRDPKCTSNCFGDAVTKHPLVERYSHYTEDDYEKEI